MPKRYQPGPHKMRELRGAVLDRDGGGCFYCDEPGALTLDHIIAQSRGGQWVAENLVIACETCNQRRGNLDADVFLRIVKSEQARGKAPEPLRYQKRGKRHFQGKFPWLSPVAQRTEAG